MKKLLILNGSHSEIPLITAGKALGFQVITTGNAPKLIGHKFADEYQRADFSDKDNILELAKRLKIDAICSCANDFGILTASYVAEKLGLPGHDPYKITKTVHLKNKFKHFAQQHEIITPKAKIFKGQCENFLFLEDLKLPLIIKPVDLTGGKGITKIESKNDFFSAMHTAFAASRLKKVVVEEFFEGTMHSMTTFIVNGKVIFHFCDNEFSYLNPFLISTSAAPAVNFNLVKKKLIEQIEKIVCTLSLIDGILHIQYLQREENLQIIEITRRCSGDLYPYPVQYACGIDWGKWIVRAAVGNDCYDFPETVQQGFCGRHCVMSSENGILQSVKIDNELKNNIYDSIQLMAPGEHIENYLIQKTNILFLKYDSMEEMLYKTKNIHKLIKVTIHEK